MTFFFFGGDTAPSDSQRSDDGAVVVGFAQPRALPSKAPGDEGRGTREAELVLSPNEADWRFGFCFGRSFNHREKLSARQWAGLIHGYHQRFHFQKIVLDGGAGGGGVFVKRELMGTKQLVNGVETECKPIADQVDGPRRVVHADFILHMFKRGEPGVNLLWPNMEDEGKSLAGDELLKDAMMATFKGALDHGEIATTPRVEDLLADPVTREQMRSWPEERQWSLKVLDAGMQQLLGITVATKEDGTQAFTKRGARVFTSVGRDDIAFAMMYCYTAFRIWLKADLWLPQAEEDAVGFGGVQRA